MLVIGRLLVATATLVGMSVANAALARAIARSLAFPVPGERLAAAIVIVTAGVLTGGMTAALLAHRRSWVAGATILLGTLAAATYLAAAVPADIPSRSDSLLYAGGLATAAFLAALPAAVVLRFIGRFEHLLPWSPR